MDLDFLLIADRAEAVNGKLYVMGGGWDRITLPKFPAPANFDVALGVLVGYTETNVRHEFALTLEDDDNQVVLGPVSGQFELGRPPGLKPAQAQRFMVAVRGPFPLPAPGSYHWVATLDGRRSGRTTFWADPMPDQPIRS
ncbi:MAG TPA: hypothetical protein VOB72_04225 [Candidatus Dormibacteraeota bacterium]|nr:hypothetical protein [Candidatus Dormibacteraeota bacterium]